MKISTLFGNLYRFYSEGFKNMTVGRTLWIIVIVKLLVMFLVLKIFFFPNYLKNNFPDDKSRANHVREELLNKN